MDSVPGALTGGVRSIRGMTRLSRRAARGLRWGGVRERGQEVARLAESHCSGVAVDAVGGRPADIAAPFSHVVEGPRQVFELPWCELIAAQRRGAAGIEQLTAIRPIVGRQPSGRFTDDAVDDAGGSWKLGRHRLTVRTEQELHELWARVHVDHQL
jgi:hypothetical protein